MEVMVCILIWLVDLNSWNKGALLMRNSQVLANKIKMMDKLKVSFQQQSTLSCFYAPLLYTKHATPRPTPHICDETGF